jgi:two-component system response regulator YesN
VVIADLRMPNLNGLELLKKVKTSNPNVRTILMSAYNFEEDILFLKYMEEGVIDSTIDKPVTMNRLYQRVREELNAYQSVSHQE